MIDIMDEGSRRLHDSSRRYGQHIRPCRWNFSKQEHVDRIYMQSQYLKHTYQAKIILSGIGSSMKVVNDAL